ncbi:MAG TPA: electron transporter [Clostridiales bacterium]|nr:electron transporter [Clostridiales bacterium]
MRDLLKPALVLFLICALTTAALAGTYEVTRDIIADRAAMDAVALRQWVLPGTESFDAMTEIPADVLSVYKGMTEGKVSGYVVTSAAGGYAGNLVIMAGITADGKIQGIRILSANETPGLGTKTYSDAFLGQFQGEAPAGGFVLVKNTAKSGEIEAVSGATLSSRAVTRAVNTALAAIAVITGKEGTDHGK